MIILIGQALTTAINQFEEIVAVVLPIPNGKFLRATFSRLRDRRATALLMRCFNEDGNEYDRYRVAEIHSHDLSHTAVMTFHAMRLPKIIKELSEEWICEMKGSHMFITYRANAGETYAGTDEDDGEVVLTGDMISYYRSMGFKIIEPIEEPYALDENSPLTQNETSVNMELDRDNSGNDVMPSAFDDYFRSDDWKYSNE